MSNLLSVLYLLIITIFFQESLADEACGEWTAFKDEKCFKIIDDPLINYTAAIESCSHQDNSGSLAIIESKEEQEFLTNFVFNTKNVADNVWIGIQKSMSTFTTIDNSELSYTNWAPGSPQNESGYNCLELIVDKALVGKWTNVLCARKNAIVCQKIQIWSMERLQRTLLDERKSLNNKILNLQQINSDMQQINSDMQQKHKLMDDTITALQQNPVPLGFIYVQLPGQSEPKLVWPQLNWSDVSSSYAGLFFRVVGGNSEVFETEQMENDRYLVAVRNYWANNENWMGLINIPLNGEWSSNIYSGGSAQSNYVNNFKLSTGEIRPRNKAVKIWKRVA